MDRILYRYRFEAGVPLGEVESTLALAIAAAEAQHGPANVRLGTRYTVSEPNRACVIEAGAKAGETVVQIFTGLITSAFGEDAFKVSRDELLPGRESGAKKTRVSARAGVAKGHGEATT